MLKTNTGILNVSVRSLDNTISHCSFQCQNTGFWCVSVEKNTGFRLLHKTQDSVSRLLCKIQYSVAFVFCLLHCVAQSTTSRISRRLSQLLLGMQFCASGCDIVVRI